MDKHYKVYNYILQWKCEWFIGAKKEKKKRKRKKKTCLAVSNVGESSNIHVSLVACILLIPALYGTRLASYYYLLHEIIVNTSTLS